MIVFKVMQPCPPMFEKGKLLGKGGFACCYELYSLADSCGYAGKIVSLPKKDRVRRLDRVIREISLHKDLLHPNIVRFHRSFEYDNHIFMILELCDQKTAAELLEHVNVLGREDAGEIMRQLCAGVEYLHSNRVIHRDIKLSNILFANKTVKIADFGLATKLRPHELKLKICGTPNYIAPEILKKTGYGFPVDVWSLGCVLYALLVGRPPFEGDTVEDTYGRIKRGHYYMPKNVPMDMQALLKKMLTMEMAKRPPITSIRFRPSSTLFGNELTGPGKSFSDIYEKDSGCSDGLNTSLQDSELTLEKRQQPLLKVSAQLVDSIREVSSVTKVKSLRHVQIKWIKSWHEYAQGFIYKLSDGTIGMLMKENTLVYQPDCGMMWFCTEKGKYKSFQVCNSKDQLKKESSDFKLMFDFVTHFYKTKTKGKTADPPNGGMPAHIVYYKRLTDMLIMGLNDGTVQINTLKDRSRVVCSQGENGVVVTLLASCRRIMSYSLADSVATNKAFADRLRRAKMCFDDLLKTI